MTDNEKHETVEQLKKEGLWLAISGVLFCFGSGSFFLLEYINYGLMCLTVAIVLFFMSLLVVIKIHGRYTLQLILKMNGKKWEDHCSCDECLALQSLESGSGKQ